MGLFERLFGRNKGEAEPVEFRRLVEQSMEELRVKTAAHDAAWRLGEADWSIDQDAGSIVFSREGGITATCEVQIIGTYNAEDGTWLWGWDHPSVVPALQEHAKRVREYGETHGIAKLTTRKLTVSEDECWEFAALACKLSDAQGAYRGPAGPTRVFTTFDNVTLSSVQHQAGKAPKPVQATSAEHLPGQTTEESEGDPETVVRAFIKALHDWEVQAYSQDDIEFARQTRAALIRRWCGDFVTPQGGAFGNEPQHHPEREAITSVTTKDDEAVVTTRHVNADEFVTDYAYHLRRKDGRWYVTSLLYVDEDEKFEML